MIGKTILHYRIIEKLGEGGMGVVYKAEDIKLKREVALKFLPPHICEDSDVKKRFENEAQTAASLNHPNITTIYAIEESDDQSFIVMEFIDGIELKQKIINGLIEIDDIKKIVNQISKALDAAHSKGIIHRDIKSSNIMITKNGKVKIMDFGLAKMKGTLGPTKSDATMGTVAYMSPEQVKGEELDYRTDYWSFGIVLYELLAGQLPFTGEYDAAIIYSILNEPAEDIQQYRPDAPVELQLLTLELLKKDRGDRLSSFAEIKEKINKQPPKDSISQNEKSVAVLYFENMSPDKDNEYFCAGITEDIIIDLSKIQELKVIPRSDVLPFRTKEVNSRKVGEVLGVTHILEGSVRKAGQQIRVSARLIDINSGFQIWAERYDRFLEDIFDLQVELSQKIAAALKVSLSELEKESIIQKPTEDLRAYDFYMRGRELLTSGGKRNNESAITMFEHAISIDSKYTLAYVALAEAYSFQYMFYDGDQKWLGKIINTNEKAQELDPELDEIEIAKGMVLYHQKRFPEAIKTFEKFIKKQSDNYTAHYWLGVLGELTEDYEIALKHFLRAAELKPYSEEPWLHIDMVHQRKGELESAQVAGDKVISLAKRKLEVNAENTLSLSRLSVNHARRGKRAAAIEAIEKVLALAPNDGLALYNCACAQAQLGNKDESFKLLKKAIGIGYKNIIEWIENDPDFAPFHDDPQFKKVLGGENE